VGSLQAHRLLRLGGPNLGVGRTGGHIKIRYRCNHNRNMSDSYVKGWQVLRHFRSSACVVAVVVISMVLYGELPAQEVTPSYGDTLIIGQIGSGLRNLNPIFLTLDREGEIAGHIYGEGLVRLGLHGEIIPGLAEAWEWAEDRSACTFTLRDGIRFHNNELLGSGDVIFTYQLYRQMKSDPGYFFNKNMNVIEDIQPEGIRKVRFQLNGPADKFFPELAMLQILPSEVYDTGTYESTRDKILRSPPVGLGPFIFSTWDDGSKIVLRANPSFYGGRSFLDGIVFRFFTTEELLKAAFVTGEIDFAMLEWEDSARDVWRANPRIRLVTLVSNQKIFECVCYNTSTNLFSSKTTRMALTHAIDRTGLLNEVLSGKGNVAYGPLDEDSWAYYQNLPKYRFDPRKAMTILREEGWSDRDRDGVLERRDQEFRFTLIFTRGSTFFERIARIIKLNLKEIGVDVIPEPVEYNEMLKRMKQGDYDAALMSFPFEAKVNSFDRIFHTSSIQSGFNVMFYSNREVDRLITLAYDVPEQERLEPMFQRLQLLIAQDQPCTFLFFKWLLYAAVDTRFQNIRKAVGGLNPFMEWYVPEEDQR
jgi:peptide/nickel transport system substrate-binding protein